MVGGDAQPPRHLRGRALYLAQARRLAPLPGRACGLSSTGEVRSVSLLGELRAISRDSDSVFAASVDLRPMAALIKPIACPRGVLIDKRCVLILRIAAAQARSFEQKLAAEGGENAR
eukprot:11928711-Alexandrium_andersonii.AAC.1